MRTWGESGMDVDTAQDEVHLLKQPEPQGDVTLVVRSGTNGSLSGNKNGILAFNVDCKVEKRQRSPIIPSSNQPVLIRRNSSKARSVSVRPHCLPWYLRNAFLPALTLCIVVVLTVSGAVLYLSRSRSLRPEGLLNLVPAPVVSRIHHPSALPVRYRTPVNPAFAAQDTPLDAFAAAHTRVADRVADRDLVRDASVLDTSDLHSADSKPEKGDDEVDEDMAEIVAAALEASLLAGPPDCSKHAVARPRATSYIAHFTLPEANFKTNNWDDESEAVPVELLITAIVDGVDAVGCVQLHTVGVMPTKVLMEHNERRICVCGPPQYSGPVCGQPCDDVLMPIEGGDPSYPDSLILGGLLPVTLPPGGKVVYTVKTTAVTTGLVRAVSTGPGPGAIFARLGNEVGSSMIPALVAVTTADAPPRVTIGVTMPSWARAIATMPVRPITRSMYVEHEAQTQFYPSEGRHFPDFHFAAGRFHAFPIANENLTVTLLVRFSIEQLHVNVFSDIVNHATAFMMQWMKQGPSQSSLRIVALPGKQPDVSNNPLMYLDEQDVIALAPFSTVSQLLRVAVTACKAVIGCWFSSPDPLVHEGVTAWLTQECVKTSHPALKRISAPNSMLTSDVMSNDVSLATMLPFIGAAPSLAQDTAHRNKVGLRTVAVLNMVDMYMASKFKPSAMRNVIRHVTQVAYHFQRPLTRDDVINSIAKQLATTPDPPTSWNQQMVFTSDDYDPSYYDFREDSTPPSLPSSKYRLGKPSAQNAAAESAKPKKRTPRKVGSQDLADDKAKQLKRNVVNRRTGTSYKPDMHSDYARDRAAIMKKAGSNTRRRLLANNDDKKRVSRGTAGTSNLLESTSRESDASHNGRAQSSKPGKWASGRSAGKQGADKNRKGGVSPAPGKLKTDTSLKKYRRPQDKQIGLKTSKKGDVTDVKSVVEAVLHGDASEQVAAEKSAAEAQALEGLWRDRLSDWLDLEKPIPVMRVSSYPPPQSALLVSQQPICALAGMCTQDGDNFSPLWIPFSVGAAAPAWLELEEAQSLLPVPEPKESKSEEWILNANNSPMPYITFLPARNDSGQAHFDRLMLKLGSLSVPPLTATSLIPEMLPTLVSFSTLIDNLRLSLLALPNPHISGNLLQVLRTVMRSPLVLQSSRAARLLLEPTVQALEDFAVLAGRVEGCSELVTKMQGELVDVASVMWSSLKRGANEGANGGAYLRPHSFATAATAAHLLSVVVPLGIEPLTSKICDSITPTLFNSQTPLLGNLPLIQLTAALSVCPPLSPQTPIFPELISTTLTTSREATASFLLSQYFPLAPDASTSTEHEYKADLLDPLHVPMYRSAAYDVALVLARTQRAAWLRDNFLARVIKPVLVPVPGATAANPVSVDNVISILQAIVTSTSEGRTAVESFLTPFVTKLEAQVQDRIAMATSNDGSLSRWVGKGTRDRISGALHLTNTASKELCAALSP